MGAEEHNIAVLTAASWLDLTVWEMRPPIPIQKGQTAGLCSGRILADSSSAQRILSSWSTDKSDPKIHGMPK